MVLSASKVAILVVRVVLLAGWFQLSVVEHSAGLQAAGAGQISWIGHLFVVLKV